MAKTYTGIDIGSSHVKFAVCSGGAVKRLAAVQLPESLVREGVVLSPEAMSSALKEAAKSAGVTCRDCSIVLPQAASFFRRITMPAMSAEQMKINLPYEFRDYITSDKDNYFYDYSVVSLKTEEDGSQPALDVMAAATEKKTIRDYTDMLRRAGFKLRCAVPVEFAYSNILRRYESLNPGQGNREYAILDLGQFATRVHFYTGPYYETSRAIEFAGASVDAAIAEHFNVNTYTAGTYKPTNHAGALDLPECRQVYQQVAVEVMRAINFYGFNNPKSELKDIYLCGGGSVVGPLREQLAATVELELHDLSELISRDGEAGDEFHLCPAAIGAAMTGGAEK